MTALDTTLPMPEDRLKAWSELRFVTLSLDGTLAIGATNDRAVARRVGYRATFPRQYWTDPTGVQEYDCVSSHPEVLELVRRLSDERARAEA